MDGKMLNMLYKSIGLNKNKKNSSTHLGKN